MYVPGIEHPKVLKPTLVGFGRASAVNTSRTFSLLCDGDGVMHGGRARARLVSTLEKRLLADKSRGEGTGHTL